MVKEILDVPYNKQKLGNSCFPACIRMVLRYYGDDIDEETISKKSMLPRFEGGTWDVMLSQFVIPKDYEFVVYWNGSADKWKISKQTRDEYKKQYEIAKRIGMKHKRNATLSIIKKYINRNIPVLATIRGDKFYSKPGIKWTHLIVIIGYDKTGFYYHDPHPEWGGSLRKINYDRFKKSWWNLGDLSKRCVVVIYPRT